MVIKDVPARCMAAGNPAVVRYHIEDRKTSMGQGRQAPETATTLEEALKAGLTL